MEENTTTESVAQEVAGVQGGVPVDQDGMAIPDTQLDTAADEAVDQPETQQGDVDSTDTTESNEQAPDNTEDDDVKAWAERKNLPLDDPIKLAKMVRESEQRMHQATSDKLREEVTKPSEEASIFPEEDRLRQLEMRIAVNDFYSSNPEARNYDAQMAGLVQEDPNLSGNLKALYALARFNELNDSSADIKRQGGQEALTRLAQKQQATAVKGNAVSGEISPSTRITSANVDQLVAQNSPEWFKTNYDDINKAMAN